MIIKSLHYAENLVEIGCLEHNGCPVFVSVRRKSDGTSVVISSMPVFDLLTMENDPMADGEWMEKLVHQSTVESFQTVGYRLPQEAKNSKYEDMIKMAMYALSSCGEKSADGVHAGKDAFLREYRNHDLETTEIPEPETAMPVGEVPVDKEELFKQYLSLERDIAKKSVFHDMDAESYAMEKEQLGVLSVALAQYEDYESWKESYIRTQLQNLRKEDFTVCSYIFMKVGEYEEVLPKEAVDGFESWINSYPNAFVKGHREATEEDLKDYIALTAAQMGE